VFFLQVHGEVTDPHVDTFDREKVFIDKILAPLVQKLPQLKIVMEHITTMDAVNFIESCEEGAALLLEWHYTSSFFMGMELYLFPFL
jgi:dihydroorotase